MKGCRSCNHWQGMEEFLDRIDPATSGQKVQLGTCRRYAPRPAAAEANGAAATARVDSRWPVAASDDWCGEWDPKFD